jgi:hypothetical protein
MLLRPTERKSDKITSQVSAPSSSSSSVNNSIVQLKARYEQRERETKSDLLKLETLHASRILELQSTNQELQSQIQMLTRELQNSESKIIKSRESEILRQVNLSQQQTARMEAEKRSRTNDERDLRQKLTQVLEENRTLRAENFELTRQIEAERETVRNAELRLQSVTDAQDSFNSVLQIAHNEVAMLEHENNRLNTTNKSIVADIREYESLLHSEETNVASGKDNRGGNKQSVFSMKQPVTTTTRKGTSPAHLLTPDRRRVAFKWREGCVRSPERCDASSLLLLPTDMRIRIANASSSLHRDTQKSSNNNNNSFLSSKYPQRQGKHLSVVRSASSTRRSNFSEQERSKSKSNVSVSVSSKLLPLVGYH